jgi:hypothetical protein
MDKIESRPSPIVFRAAVTSGLERMQITGESVITDMLQMIERTGPILEYQASACEKYGLLF